MNTNRPKNDREQGTGTRDQNDWNQGSSTRHQRIRNSQFAIRRGFTLAEVVLALGVMAVGLTMASALFPAAIHEQAMTNNDVMGQIISKNGLDTMKAMFKYPLTQSNGAVVTDYFGSTSFPHVNFTWKTLGYGNAEFPANPSYNTSGGKATLGFAAFVKMNRPLGAAATAYYNDYWVVICPCRKMSASNVVYGVVGSIGANSIFTATPVDNSTTVTLGTGGLQKIPVGSTGLIVPVNGKARRILRVSGNTAYVEAVWETWRDGTTKQVALDFWDDATGQMLTAAQIAATRIIFEATDTTGNTPVKNPGLFFSTPTIVPHMSFRQ